MVYLKLLPIIFHDQNIRILKKDEETRETEIAELTLEEQVEQLASCGFTTTEMALYLGLSKKQFQSQATTPDTKIWEAIKRGQLQTDFTIIFKQLELAKSGNITAVQVFDKLQFKKKLQQLKEQIYFG